MLSGHPFFILLLVGFVINRVPFSRTVNFRFINGIFFVYKCFKQKILRQFSNTIKGQKNNSKKAGGNVIETGNFFN
jgi:hypothetical protein